MDAMRKIRRGLALQQDALRELEETLEDTAMKDIPTLLRQVIQATSGSLPVKRKSKTWSIVHVQTSSFKLQGMVQQKLKRRMKMMMRRIQRCGSLYLSAMKSQARTKGATGINAQRRVAAQSLPASPVSAHTTTKFISRKNCNANLVIGRHTILTPCKITC